MVCKTCGKEIHYCSSCDYDKYLYEDFCDEVCFSQSKEYKQTEHKLETFWTSLDDAQKNKLFDLWDGGILTDDLHESKIDEIFILEKK